MNYDECQVLTNDLRKEQAGGLPRHAFLLAAPVRLGPARDEEVGEVLLLRVLGPSPLPPEDELVRLRAEVMRELVTGRGREGRSRLDVLTRNEIQFSALRAKVLGTFFETRVGGTPLLAFGSEVDTLYASGRYRVYKPHGPSLTAVAGFPLVTENEGRRRQEGGPAPRRARAAAVRYCSTRRPPRGPSPATTAGRTRRCWSTCRTSSA